MRRVTLHHHGPAGVVEIDGTLDIVAGYDLRRVFGHALRSTTGALSLDLSRVSAADDDGVAALRWCSETGDRRAAGPDVGDLQPAAGARSPRACGDGPRPPRPPRTPRTRRLPLAVKPAGAHSR